MASPRRPFIAGNLGADCFFSAALTFVQRARSAARADDVRYGHSGSDGRVVPPIRRACLEKLGVPRVPGCLLSYLNHHEISLRAFRNCKSRTGRLRASPTPSSRFHLTMDTLAVQLTLTPRRGCVEVLHLQVSAHYRAHQNEGDEQSAPFRAGLFPMVREE